MKAPKTEEDDPREVPHHPRRRSTLVGHRDQETRLLEAYMSGRLHHAWLIAGPRGIGKATLAYRFAKFILANPDPRKLALSPPHDLAAEENASPVRLVQARGHPDLLVVERALDPKSKKVKAQISVEDSREVGDFFSLTAAMGGWRIAIVDAADDLNASAANALLKVLEEPPRNALFLMVSHSPGRLLPTIRSRCIRIDLDPLTDAETAAVVSEVAPGPVKDLDGIAALAQGSPGRALQLLESAGATQFRTFAALARPSLARGRALDIADAVSGRGQAEDFAIFCDLLLDWVAAQARDIASRGEAAAAARWAEAHAAIGHSIRRTNALNLDRRQTILEAFGAIEQAQPPVPHI